MHQSAPIRVAAVMAPILAVAPVALGMSGGWIALHLLGGAVTLIVLGICAWQLPGRQRWIALGGVAVSLLAISVVTSGGTIGPAVQILMLIVLAAIYVFSVVASGLFSARKQTNDPADPTNAQ